MADELLEYLAALQVAADGLRRALILRDGLGPLDPALNDAAVAFARLLGDDMAVLLRPYPKAHAALALGALAAIDHPVEA